MTLEHEEITEKIIGAAFEVHKVLGYGFLEKVYQKAMQVELKSCGSKTDLEKPVKVKYKGTIIGDYFADLMVEDKVIVELKVAEKYNSKDEAQLINELRATGISVGLLINFGKQRVEFKRFAYSEKSAFDPRSSAAETHHESNVWWIT